MTACSSTTDEVGRCDRAPTPDGGADGSADGNASDGGRADADGGGADTDAREAGVADAGTDVRDGATSDGVVMPADASPPDTGNATDAGAETGGTGLDRFIAGGGCHCATGSGGGASPWLAALAALAIFIRRRRR